jgi:hypothetical protein
MGRDFIRSSVRLSIASAPSRKCNRLAPTGMRGVGQRHRRAAAIATAHGTRRVLHNQANVTSRAGDYPSKTWCGRRDLNPHGPFKPCGFSYRLRLSPPGREAFAGLTPSLRSGLSLHRPPENPELRCCPSSLYTFPADVSPGLARDCHFKVSPTLSSSASPVSQTSTQVFLKSAAYAIPPRPRAAA